MIHPQCISVICQSNIIGAASLAAEKVIPVILVGEIMNVVKPTPCIPSPCGFNAVCREQNGAGSCTCQQDYIGNPYEGCRPECTMNSDCTADRACIRSKCQNPCPGFCGYNAICQVVNHAPLCVCQPGYSGNPFISCNIVEDTSE